MSDELCGRSIKHRDGTTTYCAMKAEHKTNCLDESAIQRQRDRVRESRQADPGKFQQYRVEGYARNPGPERERSRLRQKALADYWRGLAAEYKIARGCERCKYNQHHVALEFDHIDRALKVSDISKLAHRSKTPENHELFWAEIAKCRVLCSNCHRIKTFEEDENHRLPCTTDETSVP